MTEHIFLSYRSLEIDFALKLAADLKNTGVNLWMDRLDGIQVGVDWRDTIERAINNCGGMIAVLSPDYVTSEYCRKEIARANSLNRTIFPVLLRTLTASEIPFTIEGIQWEDFTKWHDEQEYSQSLGKLLRRIKKEAFNQVGNVPDPESRYLTSLIADLESRRGVLEYVEISTIAENVRPEPTELDEWGFAELIHNPKMSVNDANVRRLESIEQAIEQNPKFVLLGEPGAGKTTTIRRLARNSARKRLDNPKGYPIPLLLYLPKWNDETTVLDFIKVHWPFDNDPSGALRSGDILLFLDGLNEMGGDTKDKVLKLSTFLNQDYGAKSAIITCRISDYSGDMQLGNLPTILAQKLNKNQIIQFTKNYLNERSNEFLSTIFDNQNSSRSLGQLVENPYMLSALAFLYDLSPTGSLPSNLGMLFSRLVRALWTREIRRGSTENQVFEDIKERFSNLAYAMIDDNMSTDVAAEYAVKKLGDENLLRLGQNATFIMVRNSQVRFYHQLLQEYFAAEKLSSMSTEELNTIFQEPQFIQAGRVAGKWDQVIIALCGITSNVDAVLSQLMIKDPWLASNCIVDGVEISDETRNKVIDSLSQSALKSEDWSARASAIRALSRLNAKIAIPILKEVWDKDPISYVRWSAVKSLRALEVSVQDIPLITAVSIGTPSSDITKFAGTTIANYVLREFVGIGSFGAVYSAIDIQLQRNIAIKIIRTIFTNNLEFFSILKNITNLQHPSICMIYEFGFHEDVGYLTMPFLRGGTLRDRLVSGAAPSLGDIASILQAIARACDYAHMRGIVHGNITLSNIMFDEIGSPYLTDFGISRLSNSMGTPTNLAPELWRGEDPTPATDQYALAIIIYLMVTGVWPIDGDTPHVLQYKHLNVLPLLAHEINPNVSKEISYILNKALAKNPDDRFPTASAFAETFARVAMQSNNHLATNFASRSLAQLPNKTPNLDHVQHFEERFNSTPHTGIFMVIVVTGLCLCIATVIYLNPLAIIWDFLRNLF